MALGTSWEAHSKALASEQRSASMPMFADVAAIEEHFAAANLVARRLTPDARFAKPSSVKELAVRAKAEVPPTSSLMNPRNQTTSPLPPKEVLLPWVPTGHEENAHGQAPIKKGAAKALLSIVPELFDVKRLADLDAERRQEPRPDMPTVVRAHLGDKYNATIAAEKLVALRMACALHAKSIPRVAIFQSMMGWAADGLPWDATKSAACLLLMMWLQPPVDEATKVEAKAATLPLCH